MSDADSLIQAPFGRHCECAKQQQHEKKVDARQGFQDLSTDVADFLCLEWLHTANLPG